MSFVRTSLCLVLLLYTTKLAIGFTFTTKQQDSALDLIILHNNDMHARFEQTDKYSSKCLPADAIANKCYGGFARVSELIKKYRKEAENGGPSVLYLNAGDTYTGTPWFSMFKHEIVSSFLNILKPDAMVSGKYLLILFSQSFSKTNFFYCLVIRKS